MLKEAFLAGLLATAALTTVQAETKEQAKAGSATETQVENNGPDQEELKKYLIKAEGSTLYEGEDIIGSPDAPVTVVEYASYTCSHCATFYQTTYKDLKEKYVDTGKVRFVLRDLIRNNVDFSFAVGAECISDSQKRIEYKDKILETQREWLNSPKDAMDRYLGEAGLSKADIEACLKEEDKQIKVFARSEDRDERIKSTPSFLVEEEVLIGAHPLATFERMIDKALKKSEKSK